MAIGSFKGLYTFLDIEEIYGIDASCLRKKVARGKFVIDEDIKKIGTTWIITEQAMIKNFWVLKFEEFKNKKLKEKSQMKKTNSKKFKKNKKADSMNEKEEKVNDSWSSGGVKGLELKSFSF